MTVTGFKCSVNQTSVVKQVNQKEGILSALPPELLIKVFKNLPKVDQEAMSLTCKQYRNLTVAAMQEELYEAHEALMVFLKPFFEKIPKKDRIKIEELPRFFLEEPGGRTRSGVKYLQVEDRVLSVKKHHYDSIPKIANLLHKSLGLPLEDMQKFAREVLPCKSKDQLYDVIYSKLLMKTISDDSHPVYRTQVGVDALYFIAHELGDHEKLLYVGEDYRKLGNLTRAVAVLEEVRWYVPASNKIQNKIKMYWQRIVEDYINLGKLMEARAFAVNLEGKDKKFLLNKICKEYLDRSDIKNAMIVVTEMGS